MANGERFETCAIPTRRGSGSIVFNGATAHLGKVGDVLTIMRFTGADEHTAKHWKPRVLVLGEKNRAVKERGV